MIITPKFVETYLKYLFPDRVDDSIREISAKWIKQSESGDRDLSNYFIYLEPPEKIVAAVHTELDFKDNYRIALPSTVLNTPSTSSQHILKLIEEASIILKEKGAAVIDLRIVEKKHLEALFNEMPHLGFTLLNSRVEYEANVGSLPLNIDNPFQWIDVPTSDVDNVACAAVILERAGDGDPEWGSSEHNIKLLEKYLNDSEFIPDPRCLQIGLVDSKPVAVILTQVTKSDGWSRIAYMGLLPEFRGKGWGEWLHKQAFEVMRNLGGNVYRGGTRAENKAMQALFEKHCC